ncbi:MAG: methionyl-tRNA formyltransferase [Anaerolineaceae bacterium]|nr:methionyl-tRNA formyltransferase [Anaerolineaceae bacterium]
MIDKKIVFMGSPEFAIPSFERLVETFNVVGVVTQPDRPAGRGKEIKPPPVKQIAEKHKIECIQPVKLREPGVFEKLVRWNPDVIIVVAFGQILRQDVLELPNFGCVNVHGSLLPRWRGAAPIQAAILNGDIETGITIMKMDAGIDTGPILQQQSIKIYDSDTTESLGKELSELGAQVLIETLYSYFSGKIHPVPQSEIGLTYAPMLKKEDGLLGFSKSAVELDRQVRAFYPWPGTYMMVGDERIKIISTRVINNPDYQPGERAIIDGFPVIGTLDGVLKLESVQPSGKKNMSGKIFINGFRDWL